MEKLLFEPEISLAFAVILLVSAVVVFRVYSKFVKHHKMFR
ncbi:hypothetical protein FM107_07420 [Sphingobacterium sp. JB170]|nr:hypothetical protein FM107_07420 [Sphingobacterium sp. JB170]